MKSQLKKSTMNAEKNYVPSGTTDPTIRRIRKQDFSNRLKALLTQKGWRQADLARATGLGRDSVSSYCKGKTVPSRESLLKMAKVLSITGEELYPNYAADMVQMDEAPTFELRAIPGKTDSRWLTLNQEISNSKVTRILAILDEKDD